MVSGNHPNRCPCLTRKRRLSTAATIFDAELSHAQRREQRREQDDIFVRRAPRKFSLRLDKSTGAQTEEFSFAGGSVEHRQR
ncbi:hypothetical protein BH10PLA2_BH10PLA2_04840 [soil metagenome]